MRMRKNVNPKDSGVKKDSDEQNVDQTERYLKKKIAIIWAVICVSAVIIGCLIAVTVIICRRIGAISADTVVQMEFLEVGLAIIGVAVVVWAGLNIANALDRNDVSNAVRQAGRLKVLQGKVETVYDNAKELTEKLDESRTGVEGLAARLEASREGVESFLDNLEQTKTDVQTRLEQAQFDFREELDQSREDTRRQFEETREDTRRQFEESQGDIRSLNERFEYAQAGVQDLSAQVELSQQGLQSLSEQFEASELDARNLNERFEVSQQSIQSLTERFEDAQAGVRDLSEQFELSRLGLESLSEQFEASQRDARNLNERFEVSQQDARSITEQLETSRQDTRELADRFEQSQQNVQGLADKIAMSEQGMLSLNARLAQSQQNVQSLADKIAMSEQGMQNLNARFAQSHQDTQDLADRFEVSIQNVQDLAEQFEVSKQGVQGLAEMVAVSSQGVQSLNERFEQSRRDAQGLAAQVAASAQGVQNLNARIEQSQQNMQGLAAQVAASAQGVQSLNARIEQSRQDTQNLSDRIEQSQQNMQGLADRFEASQQNMQGLAEMVAISSQGVQSLNERFEQSRRDTQELADRFEASIQNVQGLAAQFEASKQGVQGLAEQVEASNQGVQSLSEQLEESKRSVQGLAEQVEASQRSVRSLAERLEDSSVNMRSLTEKLEGAAGADTGDVNEQIDQSRALTGRDIFLHELLGQDDSVARYFLGIFSSARSQSFTSEVYSSLTSVEQMYRQIRARHADFDRPDLTLTRKTMALEYIADEIERLQLYEGGDAVSSYLQIRRALSCFYRGFAYGTATEEENTASYADFAAAANGARSFMESIMPIFGAYLGAGTVSACFERGSFDPTECRAKCGELLDALGEDVEARQLVLSMTGVIGEAYSNKLHRLVRSVDLQPAAARREELGVSGPEDYRNAVFFCACAVELAERMGTADERYYRTLGCVYERFGKLTLALRADPYDTWPPARVEPELCRQVLVGYGWALDCYKKALHAASDDRTLTDERMRGVYGSVLSCYDRIIRLSLGLWPTPQRSARFDFYVVEAVQTAKERQSIYNIMSYDEILEYVRTFATVAYIAISDMPHEKLHYAMSAFANIWVQLFMGSGYDKSGIHRIVKNTVDTLELLGSDDDYYYALKNNALPLFES